MSSIKYLGYSLGLFILTGCGMSKMMVKAPLNADNQKKIYDIANYSKTFGQLDTRFMTDSPFHIALESGFYAKDHFRLDVKARNNSDSTAFYFRMTASHGKSFVRSVRKNARKAFLNEIKEAIPPVEVIVQDTSAATPPPTPPSGS